MSLTFGRSSVDSPIPHYILGNPLVEAAGNKTLATAIIGVMQPEIFNHWLNGYADDQVVGKGEFHNCVLHKFITETVELEAYRLMNVAQWRRFDDAQVWEKMFKLHRMALFSVFEKSIVARTLSADALHVRVYSSLVLPQWAADVSQENADNNWVTVGEVRRVLARS